MENDETKIENENSPADKLDLNELNSHYDESGELEEPEEQSQPQQHSKEQDYIRIELPDSKFEMSSSRFNVLELLNLFLQLKDKISGKNNQCGYIA